MAMGESAAERGEIFPWAHVDASRKDTRLQSEHPAGEGLAGFLEYAAACPECRRSAASLEWLYFRSPPETWRHLVGREGWLSICEDCHQQVDFFLTVMN